jgi:hypothetical protein
MIERAHETLARADEILAAPRPAFDGYWTLPAEPHCGISKAEVEAMIASALSGFSNSVAKVVVHERVHRRGRDIR